MNSLPHSDLLNIGPLSRLFYSTSASYKFLLFKSILDSVQRGERKLSFEDLALKSISQAWYSIHFYKISYGYSDRMTQWVRNLDEDFKDKVLISELNYEYIYSALKELNLSEFKSLKTYIAEFSKLVPYRLLTPWFHNELKGIPDSKKNDLILELSQKDNSCSFYKLIKDNNKLVLEVNSLWCKYLVKNYSILNGWWSFNFLEYLQKRNPTVLSLATKLTPPQSRNMETIKSLFKDFFQENESFKRCLYTDSKLTGSISHDHFLPWSFLGSDPLYNFVPTSKKLNSSKNNQIPAKKLVSKVGEFQFEFFKFLIVKNKVNAIEFYLNDLHIQQDITKEKFIKALHNYYEPLFLTAKNQGFVMGWMPKSP